MAADLPTVLLVGRLAARMKRLAGYLLLAVACTAAAEPPAATTIRIGGTGGGAAILQRLTEDYRHVRPDVRIEVALPPLGTSGAFKALAAGRIDLAVLGREPKADELPPSFAIRRWARTQVVFATSGGTLAGGLSHDRLAVLLRSGGHWNDGTPVRLVLRHPAESDYLPLRRLIAEFPALLDIALANPVNALADTDLDAIELLGAIRGSLGTTTYSLLRLTNAPLTPLPFDGVAPGRQAGNDPQYPLTKTIYLAHRSPPPAALRSFLDWLDDPTVVRRQNALGLVPLTP